MWLSGCDPAARSVGAGMETRDSAGVTIVDNRGEADSTFTLVSDLRLGSVEADAPDLFSDVVAVGVSPSGDIVVGDRMSTSARVFDETGGFIAAFGARGEGPGELSQLDDVMVVGDTVLLIDWQRGGTVSRYSSRGVLSHAVSMTMDDGVRLAPVAHDGASWLAGEYRNRTEVLDEGEIVEQRAVLLRYDWNDPAPGPEAYSRVAAHLYGVRTGSTSADWPLFGRVQMGYGFDGAGRYYDASITDYAVRVWGADGLERIVRRDVALVPITPEVVAQVRDGAVEKVDSLTRNAPVAVREQQVEQTREMVTRRASHMVADSVPPIAAILVGRDGSIWVNRRDGPDLVQVEVEAMYSGVLGMSSRATRWDVFAPDGRFRGRLEVPPRTRVYAVSEHHAWGVALDDLDVPFVQRWSLEHLPG